MYALLEALRMVAADLPPPHLYGLTDIDYGSVMMSAQEKAFEDLRAFRDKDPAAHNDELMIDGVCNGFTAVVYFRVASELQQLSVKALELGEQEAARALRRLARFVSERGLSRTGVEIHPAARIGRRMTIDHGHGTVIGETVEIGDDAYILNDVLLGAAGIAQNPQGRRHPKLGDRVQVGGHVQILGPIEIGDDVFIGAGCLVKTDVPSGTRVTRVSEYQISRSDADAASSVSPPPAADATEVDGIHAMITPGSAIARVFGRRLHEVKAALTDRLGNSLNGFVKYSVERWTHTELDIRVDEVDAGLDLSAVCLRVESPAQPAIAIVGSLGLKRVLEAVARRGEAQ